METASVIDYLCDYCLESVTVTLNLMIKFTCIKYYGNGFALKYICATDSELFEEDACF